MKRYGEVRVRILKKRRSGGRSEKRKGFVDGGDCRFGTKTGAQWETKRGNGHVSWAMGTITRIV